MHMYSSPSASVHHHTASASQPPLTQPSLRPPRLVLLLDRSKRSAYLLRPLPLSPTAMFPFSTKTLRSPLRCQCQPKPALPLSRCLP
eukprot:1608135-Pleurochrysis_carterae.AAC.1